MFYNKANTITFFIFNNTLIVLLFIPSTVFIPYTLDERRSILINKILINIY